MAGKDWLADLPDEKKALVGRCGIYCGACKVHRAYKDQGKLVRRLADEHGCGTEDIKCLGCQKLAGKGQEGSYGRSCEISKCLDKRGYQFCFECDKVSFCKKLDKWIKYCRVNSRLDLVQSLRMIKEGRTQEWLDLCEKRWVCPSCEKPISFDLMECHHCGYETRKR